MSKKGLTDIVKDAGLLPEAKKIWLQHPFLEQISGRMLEFIGIHPQTKDGKPLLVTAIVEAILAFNECKKNHLSDADAIDCYIFKLIVTGAEIFNQDVCVETDSGTVKWLPFDYSATEFALKFPADKVQVFQCPTVVPRNLAISCVIVKTVPQALWSEVASPKLFDEMTEAH